MLAATVLHWGRFHQGSPAFFMWTIIYILTPLAVPFLWWRNRATASLDMEDTDVRFSSTTRWVLGVGAALGALAFVVVIIRPAILISLAPWKLTELTARVFAGWTILTLLTVLNIAYDGRWSAARILVESAMVGVLLTLLALPRIWGDFDRGNPLAYLFVAASALTLIVFAVIHWRLDGQSRRKQPRSRQLRRLSKVITSSEDSVVNTGTSAKSASVVPLLFVSKCDKIDPVPLLGAPSPSGGTILFKLPRSDPD